MTGKNILTRADYKALCRELRNAEDELAVVIERQGEVLGDEGEEALIYDAMTARQDLEDRIARLREQLTEVILADEVNQPDIVSIGDRVTLRNMDDKDEFDVDVVSIPGAQSDIPRVTINSPVGKAIIGREVKNKVEVTTPSGPVTYKIMKIEPTPDEG